MINKWQIKEEKLPPEMWAGHLDHYLQFPTNGDVTVPEDHLKKSSISLCKAKGLFSSFRISSYPV
jgi:hypothetical protein